MLVRIIKKFFVYGLGATLQSALSLILLPLYLGYFAPDEYGVIAILTVVASVVSLIAGAGVSNALFRLYYELKGSERSELIGSVYLWSIAAGLLTGGFVWIFAEPVSKLLFGSPEYQYLVRLVASTIPFIMLQSLPLNLLRLEERAGAFVSLSLFVFFTDFSLKLLFIVTLDRGMGGYFESGLLSALSIVLLTAPLVAKLISFKVDFALIRKVLRLGSPYILSGLALWTLDLSDRVLLGIFGSEASVGIYALAFQLSYIYVIILSKPVSLLLDPFFFSSAAERKPEDVKTLLRKTMRYAAMIGGSAYLAIVLSNRDMLRLLESLISIDPNYSLASKFIPLLAAGPFLYFMANHSGLVLLYVEKPEKISICTTYAALANLLFNIAFIPLIGIWAAACSTLAAHLLHTVLLYSKAEKLFFVGYDWREIGRYIIYLLVGLAMGTSFNLNEPISSAVTKVVVGLGTYIALCCTDLLIKNRLRARSAD